MSRDKFEAWDREIYGLPDRFYYTIDGDFQQLDIAGRYSAWLAGRESMRDEAAKKCEYIYGDCDSAYTSDYERYLCSDAVKKIEL